MIKVEELTHAYISKFCDFEHDVVLTNHFHTDWEADILTIDAEGFSHEIEIKLSKSDFRNDFKKSYLNANTGERFLKHMPPKTKSTKNKKLKNFWKPLFIGVSVDFANRNNKNKKYKKLPFTTL